MARKHSHKPWFHKDRLWPLDDHGNFIEFAPRRAHKLMTHIQVTPSAVASAKKRSLLYMHAAERKRLGLNAIELRLKIAGIPL